MASRFLVGDNDVIEELKTSSEYVTMHYRKCTNLLVGVFTKLAGSIQEDRRRHTRFKNLTSSQFSYE